ncbi:hypothetical protein G7046_g6219 [Stylonectria norvegica]|nr:hypothetical protein G7046_g6219 [Stylonectria norvegica]
MDSSNRAPAPTPLNLPLSSGSSSSEQTRTSYFDSPSVMEKQRTFSYSSEASGVDSLTGSPPKSAHSWIKPSATVNVHTTCGRHTDQLLFGGPSLTELARSMLRKH